MRWLRTVRLRVRSLLRRHRVDAELDREIQFHLEQQTEENIEAGMSADDARDAARRAVGSLTAIQEQCRDERGLGLVDDMRRDVMYAVRALRRHAGFTTVAVLTLGLGIGVTTAVFSVVNAVLLRPLPYANADRLVSIVENVPADESPVGRPARLPSMSTDDFEWWRRNVRTLSQMAVVMPETRTVKTPKARSG